ncbi:MAG: choice-of-anchor tandem repeat GloVer-containing protein [Candidatus Baltobacteraceae bacterium]
MKQHQYSVLYSFTGYADGSWPRGGVIEDASGAFYGTTQLGGSSHTCVPYNKATCGTVFKLTPSPSGYTESVVHSFTGRRSDGADPMAGLILGEDGALYGTTSSDDRGNGCGTLFELTPSASGYMESTIYTFPNPRAGRGAPPCEPEAGLILRGGTLYGTTLFGGRRGEGSAFKLRLAGRHEARTMHQFADDYGVWPFAGLTFGKDGALYGTTSLGGSYNRGVVFKLTPREKARYAETVLVNFGDFKGTSPYGGVIFDNAGALYGTTAYGGTGTCRGTLSGCGTVFKLTPLGSGYVHKTLYSFRGYSHSDGSSPYGNLIFDKSGALYGMTSGGGKPWCNCGTVFKLTPSGSGYEESILHRFGGARPGDEPQGGSGDGGGAQGGLILGKDGALYGTALHGGTYGEGMVFRIVP